MFSKIARSANDVFINLASIALDPKVIGYVIKYPSMDKKKDQYKFVKVSGLHIAKNPKAKASVIQTPTLPPFNPSTIVAESIQKTQGVPKIHNTNTSNPKPTYGGISAGRQSQIARSANAPFKRSVGIFNVANKYR